MNELLNTLEDSWKKQLYNEFSKPYMQDLQMFLEEEKKQKIIYPELNKIFNAFLFTPIDTVKIVILGQDPYHGAKQAHGLSFSVEKGVMIPPSLLNIYKELNTDLNIEIPDHGCLDKWAKQGVLLLNSVLTVQQGKAAAHQKKGWEIFTDKVIEILNNLERKIIFVLWGNYAQQKGKFINNNKHYVLQSVHPSPLSVHRGFWGSKPFSKINHKLNDWGLNVIDWSI